jgi:hypothetical protein
VSATVPEGLAHRPCCTAKGSPLATVRASGLPFAVHYAGAGTAEFAAWLGEDVPLVAQGEGDLGAMRRRMVRSHPPSDSTDSS